MKSILKYIYLGSFLFLLMSIVTSCEDDDIKYSDSNNTNTSITDNIEGFSIGFNVSLDIDVSTRGEEEIENFIDTKNKFRILFFDSQGNFIFEAIDRIVTPIYDKDKTNIKSWFVHIPMNYIVDRNGNIYDVEKIKNKLKTESFKIAVLANWENGGIQKEDVAYPDPNGDGEIIIQEDVIKKGDPTWSMANSTIYDPTGDDKDNASYIGDKIVKNINDLHHLQDDSNYTSESRSSSSNPYPKDVYKFIVQDGKMGAKTNWVESTYSSSNSSKDYENSAAYTIRNNWHPFNKDLNDEVFEGYDNLWYVCNFTACHTKRSANFSSDNLRGREWLDNNHSDTGPISNFIHSGSGLTNDLIDNTGDFNMSFTNTIGASREFPLNDNTNMAIRIPNKGNVGNGTQPIKTGVDEKGNDTYMDPFGFCFTATSSGTLRIKCSTTDGNNVTTRLAVYCPTSDKTSGSLGPVITANASNPEYVTRKISVTAEPVQLYIYCDRGYNVDIYEIEYIKDEYLYETARIYKKATEDFPIPMYGVQSFSAISSWKDGTTYTLPSDISLIRSLAKITLYIQGSETPEFVYLRSANRTSRCEPIDVETPTNQLWSNIHSASSCEWFNIKGFGPSYNYGSKQTSDYQTWLSWFYGSWLSTSNWKYSGSFKDVSLPSTSYSYPHLFNPSINRSDFALLNNLEIPSDKSGYHKYVFYMPDRNIDDPNDVGVPSSIPKVAHIEFRYKKNQSANLDDNNCYRIYFTEYPNSYLSLVSDKANYETDFEQNLDALKSLWPIMRNHRYSFTVVGGTRDDGSMVVSSSITNWDGSPVE